MFLLGLFCRGVLFFRPHQEGDEVVYQTLVAQLDAGRGYTLHDTWLLKLPVFDSVIYDRPLFIHPPGGVALFWLLHRLFGDAGFSIAQLLSYAVFFWAMLWLATEVLRPLTWVSALIVSGLSAFSPIMTHVVSRYWLDGPLLAFSTLSAALFLHGAERRGPWIDLGGVVLGYATLIKTPAVLVVPGVVFLALAVAAVPPSSVVVHAVRYVGIALLVHLPWEVWHFRVDRTLAFLSGVPTPAAIAASPYVYYVTSIRGPLIYLRLLPVVLWTLVPSLLLLCLFASDRLVRLKGLALVGWMGIVVGTFIVLARTGYAKYMRYVILVSPASILLFALVVTHGWYFLGSTSMSRARRRILLALMMLAAVGFGLEVAQGLRTPLLDNYDVIIPVFGAV